MSDINPFTGGTNDPNTAPNTKIEYPLNWVQATSAGHMFEMNNTEDGEYIRCLLYTSPSPRDGLLSRMPSSA